MRLLGLFCGGAVLIIVAALRQVGAPDRQSQMAPPVVPRAQVQGHRRLDPQILQRRDGAA